MSNDFGIVAWSELASRASATNEGGTGGHTRLWGLQRWMPRFWRLPRKSVACAAKNALSKEKGRGCKVASDVRCTMIKVLSSRLCTCSRYD